MKLLTFLLIAFSLFGCTNSYKGNNLKLTVHASVIRSYDSIITIKNNYHRRDNLIYDDTSQVKTIEKYFDISLAITNKSTNPVYLWMMTCSKEQDFTINNDYMKFRGWSCDSNYPKLHCIKSNDSLVYQTTIYKSETTLYRNVKTTRFGLIFIDSTRCKNLHNYLDIIGDKFQHDKIIWSNPLYLND